jgi:hypothetical protein
VNRPFSTSTTNYGTKPYSLVVFCDCESTSPLQFKAATAPGNYPATRLIVRRARQDLAVGLLQSPTRKARFYETAVLRAGAPVVAKHGGHPFVTTSGDPPWDFEPQTNSERVHSAFLCEKMQE